MRNSEEQLAEVLMRSEIIKKKSNQKRHSAIYGLCIAFCTVLICLTTYYIPFLTDSVGHSHGIFYGSLIISAENIGYIVIGILAFILGVLVTMFCFHIRETKKTDRNDI